MVVAFWGKKNLLRYHLIMVYRGYDIIQSDIFGFSTVDSHKMQDIRTSILFVGGLNYHFFRDKIIGDFMMKIK